MREIKFRAWDTCEKIMIPWQNDLDLNEILRHSRFCPMQYTGLKDINGREIYEGDIIQIYKARYEIKYWGDKGFPMFDIDAWATNGLAWALSDLNLKVEVIGNVYENPELLEAASK
jgi:hypothetical protein